MPRLNQFGTKHADPLRTSSVLLLLCIVLTGFTLRVWQINFDQGIGSHPDERSTSCFYATQIALPQSWDEFWDPQRSPLNPLWDRGNQQPRSFTYGHFPLYLGVATGQLMHWLAPVAERLGLAESTVALMQRADGGCDAIAVAGRLTIAIHDIVTILLLFLLGLRVFGQGAGLIVAAFYAFTAQAIQLSHFFAMDPASTTYTVLAVLGGVMMVQERSLRAALLTAIGAGLAIASKFSALPILAVPVTAAILVVWREQLQSRAEARPPDARAQLYSLLTVPLILVVTGVTFFVASPYAILDWESFINATLVEQGRMVRGIADMPFTRQYRNTTPYLYFLEQQIAWGLWWPLGTVVVLGTIYALLQLLYSGIRLILQLLFQPQPERVWQLSDEQAANIVLWSWVLPYFGLTGAFLAKFNRYMSPILPFVVFFAAGLIWMLWRRWETADERQEIGDRRQEIGDTQHATRNTNDEVDGVLQMDEEGDIAGMSPQSPHLPISPSPFLWLRRALAVVLTAIGIGGGLFWSLAYVNGVYNEEHTWIQAGRWIFENVPAGSVILTEWWDDEPIYALPDQPEINRPALGIDVSKWGPYEEDTAEKYELLKEALRGADYVYYSSKRIYDSVDELPERYPMTIRYYDAMFNGELGFELVLEVATPPKLFGFVFDDSAADESWSLYDHAQVHLFRKVRDLNDAEFDAIFERSWEAAIPYYRGVDSPLSPLLNVLGLGNTQESESQGIINRVIALLTDRSTPSTPTDEDRPSLRTEVPLAELPVVDNYRWNALASENPYLAMVWWWLVVALLGWVAWPFAFWIFRPLRDRGYLFSRGLGWLLAGWLLWWLASIDLAMNTVWNSWLTVVVLALFGAAAAIAQWSTIREFLQKNMGLLLAGEALFAIAFVGFVWLRMGNPDLWQLWFGGEKFMEFAMLNGILRSPTFPPVDPHFAGGIINYYYFGLYLVAFLIKLTGIYAEVAFNLAIPTLFALTVVNAFAVAYSAVQVTRPKGSRRWQVAGSKSQVARGVTSSTDTEGQDGGVPGDGEEGMTGDEEESETNENVSGSAIAPSWRAGFLIALLAPIFVTVLGNLDGMGQVIRNLANMGSSQFQSSLPGLEPLVRSWSGLRSVINTGQTLPNYDFWGPSRVIPDTINEFPYWSFLFADLHPHLIGVPLAVLFLGLILTLFWELIQTQRIEWPRAVGLLLLFALMLGTLASVNLWELPTYFGLGVLALMVGQYRRNGHIHWGLTIGLAVIYLIGAYLLYWPFFSSYVNVGASGVGFIKAGDAVDEWLAIWGFLGFILISWLLFAATRPAQPSNDNNLSNDNGGNAAVRVAPVGIERWLSAVAVHFDHLPRFLTLHRLLVKRPTLGYLLTITLIPLTMFAAAGAWFWGRTVLALCLLPLGLAWLLLWRRGRAADVSSLFVALLTITGLAVLAGTQVVFLKDFLQGGNAYRMNTVFKFFSQIWVIWGIAAAIAVPILWSGFVRHGRPSQRFLRGSWSVIFLLLFAAGFAYPIWGTPARLDMRFPGWRPEIGTLDGLAFMEQGAFDWPDPSNTLELRYDWQAIKWLLDNVRGNAVLVESSQVAYYREAGSRIASMTGLSGITGMHQSEQRYGEDVGQRGALHREFWETPDVGRMQQLLDELQVDLVYVGPLEYYLHPAGVDRVEQLAASGNLTPLFTTDGSTIYAVQGRLGQTAAGYYVPLPPAAETASRE